DEGLRREMGRPETVRVGDLSRPVAPRSGARRNRVTARRMLVMATMAFTVAVCASVAGSPEPQTTPSTSPAVAPSDPRTFAPLINTYCVGCHNQRVKTAGIAFDNADPNDVSK